MSIKICKMIMWVFCWVAFGAVIETIVPNKSYAMQAFAAIMVITDTVLDATFQ